VIADDIGEQRNRAVTDFLELHVAAQRRFFGVVFHHSGESLDSACGEPQSSVLSRITMSVSDEVLSPES